MCELKMDRKKRGATEIHKDHEYGLFKEFLDSLTEAYENNRKSAINLQIVVKNLIKKGKDMVQKVKGTLQDQDRFV